MLKTKWWLKGVLYPKKVDYSTSLPTSHSQTSVNTIKACTEMLSGTPLNPNLDNYPASPFSVIARFAPPLSCKVLGTGTLLPFMWATLKRSFHSVCIDSHPAVCQLQVQRGQRLLNCLCQADWLTKTHWTKIVFMQASQEEISIV